jgi:hypothetical protein
VRIGRNLRISLALSVAALVAAAAPCAQANTLVCNEASNGQHGGYVAIGTPDPNPPARHTDGLGQLGNGLGLGLERAAQQSPALTECGVATGGSV